MDQVRWKFLLLMPAVLGATLVYVVWAMALSLPTPATPTASSPAPESSNDLDQTIRYSEEGTHSPESFRGQVTSVSELSDVQPTDWAFQALQSLVERYGCIAGYPDGTYRGNRALTRYEFATGLNACLNRVNELVAAGTTNLVRKEDLITLQRLQQEFSTELASIRGRVDTLEAKTAQLEANQFSTTTKLVGEVVFNVSDNFGNYRDNAVFSDRARLDFQSSFTGQDTLHIRLATGNTQRFNFHTAVAPGGPNGAFATYDGDGSQILSFEPTTNNSIALDWLSYYFPLFGKGQAFVGTTGEITSDIAPVNNPYFYDGTGANGALSIFAANSPIFRIGGGAGAGLNLPLSQHGILGRVQREKMGSSWIEPRRQNRVAKSGPSSSSPLTTSV